MHPQPPQKQTRIFFPNLDGLRFISFFAVFLYHCYISFFSYLKDSSPREYSVLEFLFQHGNLGVNFFFVLSGFLITYLLIKEKEFTGSIHVGNFYLRRILRIWPLYYLCLVIGFIIFPLVKKLIEVPTENANPLYYIFLAANFDIMHKWPLKPNAINLSVLWSVAIEEQFYLSWPIILRIIPLKAYRIVFFMIIVLALVFRSFYTGRTDADEAVRYFHTFSVIGDMALGGLLAYSCSFPNKFKLFITNLGKPAISLIYLGTLAVTLLKDEIFRPGFPLIVLERLIIGIFFGLIILEQNYSVNSFFKLGKSRLLSRLGVFTYGLYCLHLLGMYLAVKMVAKFRWDQYSLPVAFISCGIALAFSIVISLGSFHFFEKWFLRLKNRFAFIVKK